VANSNFTRSTYAAAGLDVGKVRVVPLGAPPPLEPEAAEAGGSDPEGPLRLVWAGKFGILKGAHYLIEAWRMGNLSAHARLDIYGMKALPSALIDPAPEGIHFHGIVSRPVLHARFAEADALVFPTLSDGFGMVATEAWAHGLPVIMTQNAGASDLLRPGENGLLAPPGDAGALAQAILWCVANRDRLKGMRRHAVATAARNPWSKYRRALVEAVRPALGEAG
jgi:glycosyltransferase involved in cell wall biosynthesis